MADLRLCSIPGCSKKLFAKSWCSAHYARWSRWGDPLASAPPKDQKICSIEGCGEKHVSRGYCNKHLKSFTRWGDPLKSEQWLGDRPKTCGVAGCSKKHYAHGLCAAHNWRRRTNGSPTAGRVPNGEAWHFFQETVLPHQGDDCLRWPYTHNKRGYPVMARHGEDRSMLVHRLACEQRNGPPPFAEAQACHSCGHEWCCNPSHTRWDDQAGNEQDKLIHGTLVRGEKANSKLTEDDVRKIRSLSGKVTQVKMAAMFGVRADTISSIVRRKAWTWLD